MVKILFGIISACIPTFIVIAMMCAMTFTGRSDNSNNNNGGNDNMLLKKKICPRCKAGKESYELDSSLTMCPYIRNWKNNKCNFYEPLEAEKDSLIDKILKILHFA